MTHKWFDDDIINVSVNMDTLMVDMGLEGSVLLSEPDVVELADYFELQVVNSLSIPILLEQLDMAYSAAKACGIDTHGISQAEEDIINLANLYNEKLQ